MLLVRLPKGVKQVSKLDSKDPMASKHSYSSTILQFSFC